MKKSVAVFALGVLLSVSNPVSAGSFKVLGSRPTAMGGAFVAVAEGALAPYWNPAGLAFRQGFGMELPVGANIEATGGILDSAQKISDSAESISRLQDAQKSGAAVGLADLETFSQAITNLKEMEGPGKGLEVDASGGANFTIGRWAVTVNNFSSVGVDPVIDLSGVYLGSATVTSAPSPSLFRASSSESFDGIDLSKIEASTDAPSGLETESSALSLSVQALADGAGVKLGSLSAAQIANALINLAVAQGASAAEIRSAVAQIGDATPLLLNIAGGRAFKENNSNLTVRGVSLTELSFSHGRELPEFEKLSFLKGIAVGIGVKYVMASTMYARQYFLREGDSTELGGIGDIAGRNTKQSSSLALDLGLLWRRDDILFKPRAGLVGKNVNSPVFAMPDAAVFDGYADYKLDSQWRFGVAVKPKNFWLIACDIDLTTNHTEVSGYDSRNLSFGNEINIVNRSAFNFALRAGLAQNLAFSGAPMTYTGGFGLRLFGFNMDFAGAMSADKVAIGDNQELPSRAMASLALSLNF